MLDGNGAPERIRTSDPQIRRLTRSTENIGVFCKTTPKRAARYQGVSEGSTNRKLSLDRPENENAVAGVKARNGAILNGSDQRTSQRDRACSPPLASVLVAILDRDGSVCGIVSSHSAARAFLRESHA